MKISFYWYAFQMNEGAAEIFYPFFSDFKQRQPLYKIKKGNSFLSRPYQSGGRDLNSRPLPPQGSALPGCATTRTLFSYNNLKNIFGVFKILKVFLSFHCFSPCCILLLMNQLPGSTALSVLFPALIMPIHSYCYICCMTTIQFTML